MGHDMRLYSTHHFYMNITSNMGTNSTTAVVKKVFSKVPEVTIFFWIIKILCTTVGETFADFLNVNLNFGLSATSVVMAVLLAVALFFQFRAKRYIPGVYWVTVAFISVFGTLVTDNLTDKVGLPLEASTVIFGILLSITFAVWYWYEKTLSIHSIFTKRREVFYWCTILFTFALGTATGDLMAEKLGLGYLLTGIIVMIVIAAAVAARRVGLNAVLAFWIMYILTRPLGASIGDYLSQPQKYGGLGLGATGTSVIFIAGILVTVIYLSVTKRDVITGTQGVEESNTTQRVAILQTVGTIALLLLIAVPAYAWRHKALQAESNVSDTNVAQTNTTSNQTSQTTQAGKTSALGDLSTFRKITEDTRSLVVANDMPGAVTRVADLEHEWDVSQARLKPMNQAKWTEVDNAIDKVLREIRAVRPNPETAKSALDALLSVLN